MQTIVFIKDVFDITGVGAVLVGIVKSGTLKIGMKLNINGKDLILNNIEMYNKQVQEAKQGENIGFSLSGGDYNTLKPLSKQEVTFSDDTTRIVEKSIPKKGFFNSIFKRK